MIRLLRRGHDIRCSRSRRGSLSRLRALKRPQLLFELAIAVLQFLVLTGQRAQLVFQPLDAKLRIDVLLRRRANRQPQGSGREDRTDENLKSG